MVKQFSIRFQMCNFTITQTSTSTTLSNGASVIAMNNNGVIAMTNSTSIVSGAQSNLTSASNIVFSNASGRTEVASSGGSLQLNGVNVGSGCNDTYLTVDPNGFQGLQFNTAKRTGWNPDVGKIVSMVGIVDPNNANFGAFVVNLDNTISNLFKTPFGVGGDYVFAQDQFRILVAGDSNLCNILNANSMVMSNVGLNRYANSFLNSSNGNYEFAVGTISPSTFVSSIVISNNGVVAFPQGIDLSVFSNTFSSSNSIGGNVLSNGTLSNSGTGSNSIGGIALNNGTISNSNTSSNSIGGVSLSNSAIVGGFNYVSRVSGFYGGFNSITESLTLPPGIGSVYQSPYTFDTGQYMVFINQRAYETQSLVGFYYIGVWQENNTTPGAYNYNIQTNFQNQVQIQFTNVGAVITNPLLMTIFNATSVIPVQIDIFYTITKLGG
jgi:hypothetical protein